MSDDRRIAELRHLLVTGKCGVELPISEDARLH
jgi:hypothetical protein